MPNPINPAGRRPAFPRPYSEQQPGEYVEPRYAHEGMSLREWFAGQALMGLMANSDLLDLFVKGFRSDRAAEVCFAIADGMIDCVHGGHPDE